MARRGAKGELESRLDPQLSFLRVLWGLGHSLERRSKAMERTLGVTGPQRLAVRMVGLHPGIYPSDLASLLCVHPSTLTGIVQRLVDAGFVAREADPDDGRRSRLHLTPAGRVVDGASTGTVEEAVRNVLAEVDLADVERTARLLLAIQSELDAPLPTP